MNFTEKWHEEEWLKCARSFEYFAEKYIEIRSIEEGAIKFKMYPYQQRVLKEFEQNRFNIVRKFRQGGLTTLAVLWALWMCMFRTDKQILVVSKTDIEAIKAGKIVKRALDTIKESWPWLYPRMGADSKHILSFLDTKSEIEFGSIVRARGQALSYAIIDEAAFIKGMDDAWAAMYPTVSTGGNVLVISTVNGIGNWYHRMYVDAEAGRNGFNVINLSYKEHPKYATDEWAEQTRANLGVKRFAQEIEGSFLGSGDTFLPIEILTRLDQETRDKRVIKKLFAEWDTDEREFELHSQDQRPELHSWEKGALWLWQEPIDGHEYIIGADVAVGVGDEGDNSAFHVIDMITMEQVAEFYSKKIPPHIFAMILSKIGMYYNTALIAVENAGPGLAVLDKLQHSLYYENLYYTRSRSQERVGISTNRTSRPVILESMQSYIQNNLVHVYSPRLVRELNTFIFDHSKKRAEASTGNHDDLVMAFALAIYARDKQIREIPMGIDFTNSLSETFSSRKYEEIRKEIEESSSIDLSEDEQGGDKNLVDLDDIFPNMVMPFERPHDDLLREFGF